MTLRRQLWEEGDFRRNKPVMSSPTGGNEGDRGWSLLAQQQSDRAISRCDFIISIAHQ